MTAEAEHKSRVLVKAKVATTEVVTNPANQELTSIQNQLDSMSKILKSAQFSKDSKKSGSKKTSNSKSAEAKPQKSKGPAISATGPFTGDKPLVQCHRCMGWGHFKCNCPSYPPPLPYYKCYTIASGGRPVFLADGESRSCYPNSSSAATTSYAPTTATGANPSATTK